MELIPETCQKPTRDWLQHLSSNLWASTIRVSTIRVSTIGTWWSTFKQQPIFNDCDFRTWSMVVSTSVRDSMLNMNVENDMVVWAFGCLSIMGRTHSAQYCWQKKTIKIIVNNNNNTTDYHSQ